MSKICSLTGRRPHTGNNVSHSNRKTKRRFLPNLQSKRLWSEEEGRFIRMKISTAGIRLVNRYGLDEALRRSGLRKAPKQQEEQSVTQS